MSDASRHRNRSSAVLRYSSCLRKNEMRIRRHVHRSPTPSQGWLPSVILLSFRPGSVCFPEQVRRTTVRDPVSRSLAASGASERLLDFGYARQVPAAIRGSCAPGRPRPPSAPFDTHALSRPALSRTGRNHPSCTYTTEV